jgi:hypothetical protein
VAVATEAGVEIESCVIRFRIGDRRVVTPERLGQRRGARGAEISMDGDLGCWAMPVSVGVVPESALLDRIATDDSNGGRVVDREAADEATAGERRTEAPPTRVDGSPPLTTIMLRGSE